MTAQGWLTLTLYIVVLGLLAYPLARLVARIAADAPFGGVMGAFERTLYRLAGVDARQDMSWMRYAVALLLFNALGAVVVYAVQRLQIWLPWNPQAFVNVTPDSAFDT